MPTELRRVGNVLSPAELYRKGYKFVTKVLIGRYEARLINARIVEVPDFEALCNR